MTLNKKMDDINKKNCEWKLIHFFVSPFFQKQNLFYRVLFAIGATEESRQDKKERVEIGTEDRERERKREEGKENRITAHSTHMFLGVKVNGIERLMTISCLLLIVKKK